MSSTVRLPRPLRPGDRIGVTSPSAGVAGAASQRIDFCIDWLRQRGYDVEVGECMDGAGLTSAPAEQRAAELTRMLADPEPFTDEDLPHVLAAHRHASEGASVAVLTVSGDVHRPRPQQTGQPLLGLEPEHEFSFTARAAGLGHVDVQDPHR